RSGARGRTPRADATAAPWVVEHDGPAADGRMGEVSVALIQRRPDLREAARRARAIALSGDPEKRPILDDRAARAAAIEPVVGVGQAGVLLGLAGRLRIEVIERLAPDGTSLVETGPVIIVRPRLGRDVEHAAAGAPHFRVVGVNLYFHFLDRFDRRVEHGPSAQFGDRHSVDDVVVGAETAAAQGHDRRVGLILLPVELRVAGRRERRDGDARQERVAAGGNLGTVMPIRNALPPGAGRASSVALSSTPPVDALAVSISGV